MAFSCKDMVNYVGTLGGQIFMHESVVNQCLKRGPGASDLLRAARAQAAAEVDTRLRALLCGHGKDKPDEEITLGEWEAGLNDALNALPRMLTDGDEELYLIRRDTLSKRMDELKWFADVEEKA